MKTLTVTLETVTPLFLGGAELRPELRPPAFRGALRYWLRAALGGVIGDSNLAGLHKLESLVFGSTEYGSPIQVRRRGDLHSSDEKILSHKNANPRKAFGTGQKFDLLLSQLRSNEETIWLTACSALNIMLTFGGVGLRSRRGFGTLRVVQSSSADLVPLTPTTLEGWKQHIPQVTTNAVASASALARSQNVPEVPLAGEPVRYPSATKCDVIRICQIATKSAMEAVTQFMMNASGSAAFGGIRPRQASPLWVRPIQLGEQNGLLLTVLASKFNGDNYPEVQRFLDENFAGENISVEGWNA